LAFDCPTGEVIMPFEPIRCGSCGSGRVRQLAPDTWVCEHCHIQFRWIDPSKKTITHIHKHEREEQKPKSCRWCSKGFEPSDTVESRYGFCSLKCANEYKDGYESIEDRMERDEIDRQMEENEHWLAEQKRRELK
jgi:hypothetical protein